MRNPPQLTGCRLGSEHPSLIRCPHDQLLTLQRRTSMFRSGFRPVPEATVRFIRGRWLLAGVVAVAAAGAAALALPAHAATAVTFFVSPGGSDSNAGTSASAPFRTLAKAQSAV